jgi:hypothetical protein
VDLAFPERKRREWSEAEPRIARFFAVKPQKMRKKRLKKANADTLIIQGRGLTKNIPKVYIAVYNL